MTSQFSKGDSPVKCIISVEGNKSYTIMEVLMADVLKQLETTYLTTDWHLEYIKNSENSTVRKPNHPTRKWTKDMKRIPL